MNSNETLDAPTTAPALSPGQKLVGISFNPSSLPNVDRAKQIMAELYDLVKADFEEKKMHPDASPEYFSVMQHTTGEILNAQMAAVKMLTWRH